jgi:hypothetical protein
MPVARYFLFVGGVLLALLFLSDAYAPSMPVVSAAETGVNKSVIRIHTDRKWPERVVFDTSLPTIVPAQTVAIVPAAAVTTAASVAAPPVVADVPAKAPALQAFAQLKPAEPRKPELKPQHKQRKVAKSRIGPPMVLVAQQPRFGFFDSHTW